MKKIAIFVEGETERDFVCEFLREIAGQKEISIKTCTFYGGGESGTERQHTEWETLNPLVADTKYYAQIYVSTTDNRVISDINENFKGLRAQDFSRIVGLRDLRGEQHGRTMGLADLPRMELASKVVERKCLPLPVHIVIAVMEIETWFLAETHHYACIDERLTENMVRSNFNTLGFNPYEDDLPSTRPEPAEDLKKLYQFVGKSYSKKEKHRIRTIECLDYAEIYFNLRSKIVKLKEFVSAIDDFLT
ncbi:MAG: hypothetical protein B6245_02485 [Desulfobacteraceae bacterium 4572_88]|nr:MAG: hypothetical protein B6245_02485 [Desulfobacteraceae bacterium 4572_88]